MSDRKDIALMAHLMRRAGFGATRDEVERRAALGYEETVEELIDPPDSVPAPITTSCSDTSRPPRREAPLPSPGRRSGSTTW